MYLPVAAVLALTFAERPSITVAILWWLKPVFDRFVLHVLSHAVFGDLPSVGATLRAWRDILRVGVWADLTYKRISLRRSFHLPITQLEGASAKSRSARIRLLGQRVGVHAGAITIACMHFEFIGAIGIEALASFMMPADPNQPDFELRAATTRPVAELKAEALALAAQADVIIYAGGITAAQEGESFDRDSIELPQEQEDLVRALQATGKPVVMVNCSGSAMALTWEDEHLTAILQAWYPGQSGGRAVAEVLFGVVNPSGHLPVTFYRSTADLPAFTDYSMKNRTYRYFTGQPLYAFGHGLSYTKFDFANLRVTPAGHGTLKVTVEITNSGAREGDEVVQLYATPPAASQPQEIRALCGFRRVHLKAGEKQTVTITVPTVALRRWNVEKKDYAIPAGEWSVAAGASSADLRQTAKVKL